MSDEELQSRIEWYDTISTYEPVQISANFSSENITTGQFRIYFSSPVNFPPTILQEYSGEEKIDYAYNANSITVKSGGGSAGGNLVTLQDKEQISSSQITVEIIFEEASTAQ
jgi:hypothetical protein